jgi:alpha-ketoglutarate-dependent taurine dioxygenase
MNIEKLNPFGLLVNDLNLYKDYNFLVENLEILIWKNGFVCIKKLDTHWSVINNIAHILGNVAVASPVDHHECIFVGQITGQKNEDGTPKGRMGKSTEIGWHSDNCVTKTLAPFILFQGIENLHNGTQQYLSNNMVFASLSEADKDELRQAEGNFYFNHDVFQNDLEDLIKPHSNWKKIVIEDPYGNEGLFFPHLFCTGIKGTSNNNYYFNLLQTKFKEAKIYEHKWDIGDLFITESLFTQHRRPPTDNPNRLLYRVNCGKEYRWTK